MEKKMKSVAEDIRASLHEALDHAAGKRTKAVVHKVPARETGKRRGRARSRSRS
jgi:hypothetical protein